MPRPHKCRKICCLPINNRFGALDSNITEKETVIMGIDEYETIRLIDYEGLTQKECADQMDIARTTVQGMYDVARKKIADCLVNGKTLVLHGGRYQLCEKGHQTCHRHKFHSEQTQE